MVVVAVVREERRGITHRTQTLSSGTLTQLHTHTHIHTKLIEMAQPKKSRRRRRADKITGDRVRSIFVGRHAFHRYEPVTQYYRCAVMIIKTFYRIAVF